LCPSNSISTIQFRNHVPGRDSMSVTLNIDVVRKKLFGDDE
jgi:hypothetical protein